VDALEPSGGARVARRNEERVIELSLFGAAPMPAANGRGALVAGDALDLIQQYPGPFDLVATDPPYAFSGSGAEHQLSATVAVVLREASQRIRTGGWMVCFAASSWRSTAYVVEATRGILEPVRIATWCKPGATSKTRTPGWRWATVNVIALRKGKSANIEPFTEPDFIVAEAVSDGRRAELPREVAAWAVRPFVVSGGLMLDPFAGSGRLVEAAAVAGMDALGFEANP
jgi:hypothetical protein